MRSNLDHEDQSAYVVRVLLFSDNKNSLYTSYYSKILIIPLILCVGVILMVGIRFSFLVLIVLPLWVVLPKRYCSCVSFRTLLLYFPSG